VAHELQGRVWLLPDHVETSQILPYKAFGEPDPEQLRRECLSTVIPGFGERLQGGDILWAGEGFGHGSSREDAARALKTLGVRLVLAQGFARIFYRNAINIGLPVAVGDPGPTRDGDELQVNLVTGEVTNLTRPARLRVRPVPAAIRPILSEGGLLAYVQKSGRLSSGS
jgi:3-isopropylmalate dehydratase small subunit